MSPQEVLSRESQAIDPWSRMFGCCEIEQIARAIVEDLVAVGCGFDAPINRAAIESRLTASGLPTAWLMSHGHPDGTKCGWDDLVIDGRLTPWFLSKVQRP